MTRMLKRSFSFVPFFLVVLFVWNSNAEESEDEGNSIDLALELGKLQKSLVELTEEQSNFASNVLARFTELEEKVGALEDRNEEEGKKVESGEDLHTKISTLHQQHARELESLRQHHANLSDSVSSLHRNVHHLSTMHNTTERIQLIAEQIVQERWYEALLHWAFLESHIVHDAGSDVKDILEEYLRNVITYAYKGHGAGAARFIRLNLIFDFVHKLSRKQYKVNAYGTLVNHMLSAEGLFDGTEIFILGKYIRRSIGLNARARDSLPAIVKVIGDGGTVHLVYLGDGYNSSHNLRHRNKLNETDTLDMHTNASMIVKKKDIIETFKYPIYASKHYKPYMSGSWTPILRNTSYFLLQNGANAGYLNVPVGEDGNPSLLNCVPEADVLKNNIEFSFVYIDETSFLIRSGPLGKDVILKECSPPEGSGKINCFTLGLGSSSSSTNGQSSGSKFTALSVVAAIG